MKRLRITLGIIALSTLIAGHFLRTEKSFDERAYLREIAPGAAFAEKAGAPPHYASDGDLVAFNTHDVTPGVRGYAGPITVMMTLGSDGRIKGVRILSHRETKNYVHYMETPEYLGRFIGKSVFDKFEIDKDIDGISRATVSVEALAETVRDSSRAVAASVYGINVKTEKPSYVSGHGWIWYAILFGAAMTGYFITRRSEKHLRLRDASLAAGFFIIGLYLSSPFSILHVFNLVLFRPSSAALWYVIVISTLVSVIVAGRFYCGWLCPFGALSEFMGRLTRSKWAIPAEQDDRWRMLKYYLLGAIVIIVFLTQRADYGNYETYITLFSFHGNVLTWTLVFLSFVANLRIERFWCRYLCPVAALTGVFSRRAKGYPSRHDCPMANKPAPEISECIRCNRCYRTRE